MALAGPSDAYWLIPLLMFFTGCSFGFAMSPSLAANMAKISAAETGHASTLQNTVRQAGAAVGVALLGTVLGVTGASALDLAGYHLAFLAAAAVMALGVVFSRLRQRWRRRRDHGRRAARGGGRGRLAGRGRLTPPTAAPVSACSRPPPPPSPPAVPATPSPPPVPAAVT